MHCINNMNRIASGLIIASCVFYSCTSRTGEISPVHEQQQTDSLSQDTITQPEVKPVEKKLTAEQIQITKDLLYDQYTLEDTYPYKDTTRQFQWDKIKERLALLENIQLQPSTWAILQNYKNRNGEAACEEFQKKRLRTGGGYSRHRTLPIRSALFVDRHISARTIRPGWRTNPFYRRWGKIHKSRTNVYRR